MKILVMTDSFFIPTGLGRVGRELAFGLMERGHQIGYIGWFHRPHIMGQIPQGMSYWQTNNNMYGSDIFDAVVSSFRPDVVLTIGDLWFLSYISDPGQCRTRRLFQWCSYIPVDGEPVNGGIPPALIAPIEDVDIPVAYTNYAKEAVLKSCFDAELRNRIRVIYHGTSPEIYRPLPPEDRKKLREQFQVDDKFVFLTVCRNQSRKNIPEMFRAWKTFSEFVDTKDKVVFWPHMYFRDPMGWNIEELLEVLKLRNNSVRYYRQVAFANSELHLIPEVELAKLYQMADAFILLSGEGFGLPTIEAMASRLPCILLDTAASAELGADGRAELVGVNGGITWTGSHLTQRPVPTIESVVSSMYRVYKDADYRENIAKNAYEFAIQYPWKRIVDEWNLLFMEKEVPFLRPVNLEVAV